MYSLIVYFDFLIFASLLFLLVCRSKKSERLKHTKAAVIKQAEEQTSDVPEPKPKVSDTATKTVPKPKRNSTRSSRRNQDIHKVPSKLKSILRKTSSNVKATEPPKQTPTAPASKPIPTKIEDASKLSKVKLKSKESKGSLKSKSERKVSFKENIFEVFQTKTKSDSSLITNKTLDTEKSLNWGEVRKNQNQIVETVALKSEINEMSIESSIKATDAKLIPSKSPSSNAKETKSNSNSTKSVKRIEPIAPKSIAKPISKKESGSKVEPAKIVLVEGTSLENLNLGATSRSSIAENQDDLVDITQFDI